MNEWDGHLLCRSTVPLWRLLFRSHRVSSTDERVLKRNSQPGVRPDATSSSPRSPAWKQFTSKLTAVEQRSQSTRNVLPAICQRGRSSTSRSTECSSHPPPSRHHLSPWPPTWNSSAEHRCQMQSLELQKRTGPSKGGSGQAVQRRWTASERTSVALDEHRGREKATPAKFLDEFICV